MSISSIYEQVVQSKCIQNFKRMNDVEQSSLLKKVGLVALGMGIIARTPLKPYVVILSGLGTFLFCTNTHHHYAQRSQELAKQAVTFVLDHLKQYNLSFS